MPAAAQTQMEATFWPTGKVQGSAMSGSMQLSSEGKLMTQTLCAIPLAMVAGLEVGDCKEPDPRRPSLILCRSDGRTLWELAKQSGSTVDAIKNANILQAEPEAGQMLLIPVL